MLLPALRVRKGVMHTDFPGALFWAAANVVAVVVVMLVLNAGPKNLVVQFTIHPIVLKIILI